MAAGNPPRRAIRQLLAEAWGSLDRLSPSEAHAAQSRGGLLIDVRTSGQRRRDGEVPGALGVELNVLEWRFDPDEPTCLAEAGDLDALVVVLCNEGYSSALAAMRLRDLGYHRATDVVGGFVAWRAAGLPVVRR